MDGIHDMGGMHGFGAVDPAATSQGPTWGARLQAVALLSGGVRRAGIEAIPPAEYLAISYHEKWIRCCETLLVKSGKVQADRLAQWRDQLTNDAAPMPVAQNPEEAQRIMAKLLTTPELHEAAPVFSVGQFVRVRSMHPEHHHRCPRYVRGALGRIEKIPGADYLPQGPRTPDHIEPVYTVAFSSVELWGRTDEPEFELMIDLWQNYLEETGDK